MKAVPVLVGGAVGASSLLLSCVTVTVQQTGSQPGGLPDHGRGTVVYRSATGMEGFVRYRKLTRADFQAKEPVPEIAAHAKEIGANACVTFPPRIEHEVDVQYDDASEEYVARVEEAHFFALLDPSCSWWNPVGGPLPPDYILQHEQIHFMLGEIEARKALKKMLAIEAQADSSIEARLRVREQLDAAARNVIPAALAINNRFDEDTSARYAPRQQARWLAEAEAELERLPASPETDTVSDDDESGLVPL